MGKFKDLTGQRFDRLLVTERSYVDKNGKIMWKCKCDCGNELTVMGQSLRHKHTVSCGCYNRELTSKLFTKDLVGQRFGRLIVIKCVKTGKFNQTVWLCKCDCGNEKVIRGNSLRGNKTVSCGCYNKERAFKNLIGQKFGMLTVIQYITSSKWGNIWKCRCDCGQEVIRQTQSLVGGKNIKNCGCYTKKCFSELRKKAYGEAAINSIIRQYNRDAKKRGVKFLLTKDEVKTLIFEKCFYCNAEPANKIINRFGNGDIVYNGIDRIDNSKDYTKDNVTPCCWQCNNAKSDYSKREFLINIKNIYENKNLEKKAHKSLVKFIYYHN
jgi:hypothetical protein